MGCANAVKSLAAIGAQQVKKVGKFVHDQDALEAGDKGWQERSLRKGCDGQSQACKDCGEGLPRLSIEESFLSKRIACLSPVGCPWKVHGVYIRCSSQLFMRFVTVHMRSR